MTVRKRLIDLQYHAACLNPFSENLLTSRSPLALRYRVHKRDAVGRAIYKTGMHEPVLTQWVIDRFSSQPGPLNFIDIGANIGYFTCLFAKLAGPQGKVFAFEPEPRNQAMVKTNLALNALGNATLYPMALGASEATATLHIYKNSNQGRHSLVASAGTGAIEVPVRRLDDVLGDPGRDISAFDLVKIDIEGYEPFALQGGAATLAKTRCLAMEFSPDLIVQLGLDPAAFLADVMSQFDTLALVTNDGVKSSSVQECLALRRQIDVIFFRGP